jgi:hypothetical protein
MRKLLCACAALLLSLTAATALAADFSGVWTGEMSAGDTGFLLSFTFKQDGAKLTGTVQGPQGEPVAISDGKVDGDKIFFHVVVNGMTITHEGTLSGDEIKLSTKTDSGAFGGGGVMTLKRAPAHPAPAAN